MTTHPLVVRADEPSRIVALDWGLATTLLALGITPVGVPAPHYCNLYTVAPNLPASVTDVGLLFMPNEELIYELHPDMILIPPALVPERAVLSRTGPLAVFNLAPVLADPYGAARVETRRLATSLGRAMAGEALVAAAEQAITQAGATLTGVYDGRSVYLINMIDGRHVRIFGQGSLYQPILQALGLRNAWSSRTSFLPINETALAIEPEARIVVLDSVGDMTTPASLATDPVWQALPAVHAGRVARMGAVLENGGLPAARRFAQLLPKALLGEGHV